MPQDCSVMSVPSGALLPGRPEITAAAGFLSSLLRGRVSESRLRGFGGAMAEALTEHYRHHWFPEKPAKGSGYRCIRINHKMDPIIGKVASRIGFTSQQLYILLPRELTLWVDPFEVSYRIGEDGSICVLYEANATTAAQLPAPQAPVSTYPLLTCKEEMMMGRTSPPKSYMLTAAS